MTAILPPSERLWWKHPLDRVEGTWIAIAFVWCMVMFFMMVYWHAYGKQNLSTETYKTTPDKFAAKAEAFAAKASGVLAISISQVHQHLVLWFRPELIRNVRWAGEPRKLEQASDGRITPRKSFKAWQEQVRGQSEPWTTAEVAAAGELRHALIGIVLRRAEEMAEVAAELGRVNKELEAFSYTVSHDLRAPMRHIAGYVDLVQELDGKQLSDRSNRYLSNVRHAAAYAGQLVDALLDFSRMGRAELKRSKVPMGLLVREVAAELARHEGGARIEWDIADDLPTVRADPFLMQIVVRNLLSNAVKYTRNREVPRIRVGAVRQPQGDGLLVNDNGVGFQQKYIGKLFGVFQRLHKAEDFEGTGIGLASVRRIVERHGGAVWGEGVVDGGATFGFVIPREPGSRPASGRTTWDPPPPCSNPSSSSKTTFAISNSRSLRWNAASSPTR